MAEIKIDGRTTTPLEKQRAQAEKYVGKMYNQLEVLSIKYDTAKKQFYARVACHACGNEKSGMFLSHVIGGRYETCGCALIKARQRVSAYRAQRDRLNTVASKDMNLARQYPELPENPYFSKDAR